MVDDDRVPTAVELRWFKRLRKVFEEMPETLEVAVHYQGVVSLINRGATKRTFDQKGCADETPSIADFTAARVRGEESSV